MHPELPKLLDVQGKDRRLAELDARLAALATERDALDAALEAARNQIATARRALDDSSARRDEKGLKLEAQRAHQEKRRARLEQERNPRVAAQLMADVELARSILAQEESDWLRLAEETTQREAAVAAAETRLAELEAEQSVLRADLATRTDAASAEREEARAERETAAGELNRTLRTRYDRLRSSRRSEVLVPATNAICSACHTAIPRSRIGQLQADGLLLAGCEMCGAILYLDEVTA